MTNLLQAVLATLLFATVFVVIPSNADREAKRIIQQDREGADYPSRVLIPLAQRQGQHGRF